jgi:hypothetical protein
MKDVFKKLFGREPMSAEDREAFALLPAVVVFGFFIFGLAVLFS